jgi:hypothetical protein
MWPAMKKIRYPIISLLAVCFFAGYASISYSWQDETHIAIALASGY